MMFTDLTSNLKRGFEHAQLQQPALVYFLRHLHCPFGRRTLRLFANNQSQIQSAGFFQMFIHMGSDADFREIADNMGLNNYKSISDPDQEYYLAFNVRRANPEQLGTWQGLMRQLVITYRSPNGHSVTDDLKQMDGMFLLCKDQIQEIHRPETISETPNLPEKIEQARRNVLGS